MKPLSRTIENTLMALGAGDVVNALRNDSDYWAASVGPRGGNARFSVAIASFRRMVREGLVPRDGEYQVSGTLYHATFVLTDTGRALIESAPAHGTSGALHTDQDIS